MAEVSETEREQESPRDKYDTDSVPGPSSTPKVAEGRIVRGTKRETPFVGALYMKYYHGYLISSSSAHDIAVFERKNWLIHLHYIRKDFETCKVRPGLVSLAEQDWHTWHTASMLHVIDSVYREQ